MEPEVYTRSVKLNASTVGSDRLALANTSGLTYRIYGVQLNIRIKRDRRTCTKQAVPTCTCTCKWVHM